MRRNDCGSVGKNGTVRRAGLALFAFALVALVACLLGSCTPDARRSPAPSRVASPLDGPRIPDFSFAGYHGGDRALPLVRVAVAARAFGAKGDGTTDDTKALQAALDAARDGAVVLEAGRYLVRDALRIARSGVVLRGQGPERTVLVLPESLADLHPAGDPLHAALYGFIDARGADNGTTIGRIATAARRGDRRISLEAAPSTDGAPEIRAGDVVRLRMDNSDGLLRFLLGGSLAPGPQTSKDYAHAVDWASTVDSVDGDAVVLSHALRVDVRPEWGAELLTSRPTLEEIGIEDLAFEFPGTGRFAHDAQQEPGQPWPEDGFRAVYVSGASNSWVRNVEFVDADDAILLERCRFCQVERVRLRARKRLNPSGHHGLWLKNSQDCLVSDFRIETQYVHDVTVEAFANGNVFMRGRGESMSLDHHRNAPYENLFTDLDVGDGARLWNSGGDVSRGPHAGVRETLWNVRSQGTPAALPGALRYDRPGDGGWPQLNLVQVRGYAQTGATENTWVAPAPDAPPNLYEAQRAALR